MKSRCFFPRFSLTIFASILALASTISGQGTGGAIAGTVSDQNGAGIPGANVTIRPAGDTAGFERIISSDGNGAFFVGELPPGNYRIVVESNNFKSFATDVKVYVDDVRKIAVTLETVGTSPVVDILPEPPAGSAGPTPEIRSSLAVSALDKLPGKTVFGSFVKIVPNAKPETLVSGFQIDGNSGGDNTYFVDGQEVTNFRSGLLPTNFNLPTEFLQEVQIRSSGIAAEYSGAVGGVVNLVSRGGNDSWRGSLGVSFNPGNLQGSPNTVLTRFGTAPGQIENFVPNKDGGSEYFPTASIGGPIVRNRLWFYASYAPQIADISRTIDYYSGSNPASRAVTETIRYKATTRAEQALLRLDAQPLSRLRFFGTYLYNPVIQEGVLPSAVEGLGGAPQSVLGLRGAEYLATRGGRQNSQMATGQAIIDVTRNFSVVARGGYGFLNEKLDSYGIPKTTRFVCNTGTTPPPAAGCFAGFQNVASNNVRDYEVSKRTTFDLEGQLNSIGLFGRHSFRFGYGFNRVSNSIREGYTDTGIVQLFYGRSIDTIIGLTPTPGNLGSGLLQRFGTVGGATGKNQALFAQDSWTIANRLTLTFGVRFEKENLPYYGDPEYPGSTIVIGDEFDLEWNWGDKIAPRISGAFDLFGDGRSKAFASFGFYYDRLKFQALQGRYADVFYRDYFEILPARGALYTNYSYRNIIGGNPDFPGGRCPIINSQGWSVCQINFSIQSNIPVINFVLPDIAGDLKPSRTREFTAGFEQRLPGRLLLSGRYILRDLDRAIEDVGTINDQGSRQFSIVNPGFGAVCEVAAGASLPCPRAERRYDALELILDRRTSKYFFNASYTFSRLFGNYSGLSNSDESGRTAPNVGRYFDNPSTGFTADGDPDSGRLATDRPHVFKAFAGYTFNWRKYGKTSVSGFTTLQSGTPLTTIYSLYSIQNSILFGRGDLGRTSVFSETDLRAAHSYKFGRDERFVIEPYVVILNLFDQRNELGRQTQISSTNFTATTLSQGGCTSCGSESAVYQTIHNGSGLSQAVMTYLNARGVSSNGTRNDYNQPNLFQNPRSVRIGVRFAF